MSGAIVGLIFERYDGPRNELLVAVALGEHARTDGTHIYPSVQRLSQRTRLSVRAVQSHLAKMVASGWLVLVRRTSGRRGDANEYRISPEWLRGEAYLPPREPVTRTLVKKSVGERVSRQGATGAPEPQHGCGNAVHQVQPAAPKPSVPASEASSPLPPSQGDRGFEEFAAAYPRRNRIEAARRSWAKLGPDEALRAVILRALHAWGQSSEWQRDNGRFIPSASQFLRDRRWLDAPVLTRPGATTAVPPRVLTPAEMAANKERARKLKESFKAHPSSAHVGAVRASSQVATETISGSSAEVPPRVRSELEAPLVGR